MKKTLFLFLVLGFIVACSSQRTVTSRIVTLQYLSQPQEGVTINGVRWATANVAAPGTFAQNPEDTGMFYQWNRRVALSAGCNEDWDSSEPEGTMWYTENDPCPEGWRLPTNEELTALTNTHHTQAILNGVKGILFSAGDNQIFLPITGRRSRVLMNTPLVDVGVMATYWSSTQSRNWPHRNAYRMHIHNGRPTMGQALKFNDFSLRCVAIN